MMRVGTGWDIHRLTEGRALVLGGVKIDSPKGCLGHSDGDALIHAVIDSLLGACSLGDIGTLFPDTDPRYRGISSAILLEKAVSLVTENGYRIINVDTTVILQSPKLGPYRQAICEKMTALLGLKDGFFNLKAKTAEKMLAEVGEGRAVICQSICLVESV